MRNFGLTDFVFQIPAYVQQCLLNTPLLKHGQETKKVQDMRPVLAVSMVYGDTFQKK